jgi:hypothetical protein
MIVTLVESTPRRIRYLLTSEGAFGDSITITNRDNATVGDLRSDAPGGITPISQVVGAVGNPKVLARRHLRVDPMLVGNIGEAFITKLPIGAKTSHNSNTPLVVGAINFNPTDYILAGTTLSMKFGILATRGAADLAQTYYIELYNVSDSESAGIQNLSNTTDLTYYLVTLVIGSGAGEIKPSATNYEVRIYLVDPPVDPTDTLEFYSSELVLRNTIE